ncbi:MAG: ABC transporter ATP-binding protein [Armatimonadota bacterium]
MSESPILEASGVAGGYNGREVLHGVDLALWPGEFLGVIGPNGSGKSTLIKALTGILPLARGEVRVAGRSLREYKPLELARILAVVPQLSVPAFAFTVREMVEMGRHPHQHGFGSLTPEDRKAVDEAIALTDIAHLQQRAIDRLSSGELQRVTIARALAQRPRILLLDEPTAHLDIGHQLDIFELLVRLNREQRVAVLCISHDLNLAAEYCGRLLLFSVGTVYATGSAAEVVTAEKLCAVYGTLVRVEANPYSGQPFVLHTRTASEEEEEV